MRIDGVRTDGYVMENLADRIHKIHKYIYIYINTKCGVFLFAVLRIL